jgi:hypothetical protein
MRMAAAAWAVLAALALPHLARAQSDVRIDLPQIVPFPAAPEITVHAITFADSTAPRRIRLRLALDAGFGLVVYDSTVAGDDARFTTSRLLPENRDIYAEATVFDGSGRAIRSVITRAGQTGPRLQLIAPTGRSGVALPSRQVQFSWRSATVTIPPGPWVYELAVTNVASQITRSYPTADTIFTVPDTLDGDTPYRWRVVARLPNGSPADSASAASQSSFVIAPPGEAVATLLYQNFPNPFPAASSATTCVWFDLRTSAHVELMILDLRGHRVKTLIPGRLPSDLTAGRYGRQGEFEQSGCDPRLAWDGTADDGRTVPPGIYLLRFKAAGILESVKKIVFLGH